MWAAARHSSNKFGSALALHHISAEKASFLCTHLLADFTFIFSLPLGLVVFYFFDFAHEVAGEDEVVEEGVGRVEHAVFVASPFYCSFVNEDDAFTDVHDGVHVVCVDEGGDAVFVSDALYEVVDDE